MQIQRCNIENSRQELFYVLRINFFSGVGENFIWGHRFLNQYLFLIYSYEFLAGVAYKNSYMVAKSMLSTGWAKKRGHRFTTIILSNLNRSKKITRRFLSKFAVKWIFKMPPHLAYVATLPCETSMLAKQAINDKLQITR